MAGGALAGHLIMDQQCPTQNQCDADVGAVLGAAAGEMLLLPLGVHLANRRQGGYLAPLLGSVAAVGIGFGAIHFTASNITDGGLLWVIGAAIPVAQFTAAVALERRAAGLRSSR
jgi:hypothetical protein